MKTKFYLSALLLVTTIFFSCKKDSIEHQGQFEKSYKAWTAFKASSNNSYNYTVTTNSWTGYQTQTMITVLHGEIIQRTYVARSVGQPPAAAAIIHEDWTETQATLNSHTNGAKTMTIDEIYQLAKTDLLKKRSGSSVSFEAKNNGLISSCGYVPEGCQDDCFRGIYIESINKLEVDYAAQ